MTATAITSLGEVTEVTEKARRRTFPVEYKRKIVKEADACKAPGEIGALLRREGLYSSQLATWRGARERGELAVGAAAKSAGPRRGRWIHATRRSRSFDETWIARPSEPNAPRRSQRFKKVAALLGRPFPSEES